MVTKKTIEQIELFDERQNSIGFHTIYLKVENISFNESAIISTGYYYYKKETGVVVLSRFNEVYTWDVVTSIETILNPIATGNIKEALKQRSSEFITIQLTEESGTNFGTGPEDWEIHNE